MSPFPHTNIHSGPMKLLFILLATLTASSTAVKCPSNCKCSWILDALQVNCANSGLTNYPDFDDLPIEHLDLSNNYFTEFPHHLADIQSLNYLDLSNNKISYLNPDDLHGFHSLRTLLLSNNSFDGWSSVSPNYAFRNATNLQRLSLSGNPLITFTSAHEILVSESLIKLELENCGITTAGDAVLTLGLPNLEILSLSHNPLVTLDTLQSQSLRVLNLKNCSLQSINKNLISSLPLLEFLNLSQNTHLQFGAQESDNFISDSLIGLDLSVCNLDEINLSGLPSLTKVHLSGNMFRFLNANTFANNMQLQTLDLSKNSLRVIEADAFSKLKRLTKLDLSYNEIARLDRNTFRANEALTSLNLSYNAIEKFTQIISNSLRDIVLSWCAIYAIDSLAFSGLMAIQRLDLSNNQIKDFPSGMRSQTLKSLDLSNCRLSTLRNSTFSGFGELASLRLNGNRFTNSFPTDYFRSNKYLDQIWVGDNPWICNCYDSTFTNFYGYLTEKPQKLQDKVNVRCASPLPFYGRMWETACANVWSQNNRTSESGKVWSTILVALLLIGLLAFVYTCIQKYVKSRKQTENTREYRENVEELITIRRQNQRLLEQEGTPNAPSAYETMLPSYEDAIRMPKLERPVKSMVDLTASGRSRKKLGRSRTDPEEEVDDDVRIDERQRFRSEEMLSNRDKERTAQIMPFRRTGLIDHNPSGSRRFSIEDSRFPAACVKSHNLQSAEKLSNFQSYENSPYTKRRAKIAEIPPFKRATLDADSVEFLTDPDDDLQSKPGSPFARRKPKGGDSKSLAPAVEDYFARPAQKKPSPTSSVDETDFQMVIEPEVSSLPDHNDSSSDDKDLERGKRRKRKNSVNRRASGSFSAAAAAAAAEGDTSSSEQEPIVVVHRPMRETLF